jgi:hypothetical protein
MSQDWLPIETAPAGPCDTEWLLFCADSRECFVGYRRTASSAFTYAYEEGKVEFICHPTHYMSLPELPAKTAQKVKP